MAADTSSKRTGRPFWMHQVAEYLLGGVLVAQGLQSPTPVLPAVAGGLIMVNAAIVSGPLAAFRVVSRSFHRMLDLVVITFVLVAGLQPVIHVEAGARLVLVAIAVVMAFIWWQTNFAEKVRRRDPISAADGRSNEVGRLAGRAIGDGVNVVRRMRKR